MDTLFTKLNYKEGQVMHILHHPETFDDVLATIPSGMNVRKEVNPGDAVEFVVVFTTLRAEMDEMAKRITPCLKGDAIFWLAYPKGTSKKYRCDFNRDTSWEIMKPYDMMPVRQISINDDWSALRFRKTEFIKSITRKTGV